MKLLSTFLLLLIFLSCSKEKTNYNFKLESKEIISVSIDSTISPFITCSQYIPQEDLLVFNNMNLYDNSLVFLNLQDQRIEKKLKFSTEGINSPQSSIANFYYHNKDSIFFLSAHSKKFFLMNSDTTMIDNIDFDDVLNRYGSIHLEMGRSSGAFLNKDSEKVLLVALEPNKLSYMEDSESDPVFSYLNLNSRKSYDSKSVRYGINSIFNQPIQHPELVLPIIAKKSNNETLFTFPHSKSLRVLKNDKVIKEVNFESDFVKNFSKMKEFKELTTFYITTFSIEKLLYDFKNEHTYIFIDHALPVKNAETKRLNEFADKPFSILVFDKNLNKILEQKFEGKKYAIFASFIDKEGRLLLSMNNKNSDIFDEDKLQFSILELEPKL